MADGAKSGGGLASIGAFVQQWQVIVAAIAAVTALWFGFADQRRMELEINRQAVIAAKAAEAAFVADPLNTIVEFRASYPDHAFCAALGYFVAEAGRQESAGAEGAGRRAKLLNDAIGVQVERIAAAGGVTLAELDAIAGAAAGDGTEDSDACPKLRAPFGLRGRAAIRADCRLLVETFAQAQCQAKAAALVEAAVLAASREGGNGRGDGSIGGGGGVATPGPTPSTPDEPGPATETETATWTVPGASSAVAGLGPGPACGAAPPAVYLQFAAEADRAAAARVQAALAAAGWPAAGIELVAGARTAGDVRFYWPAQEECARGLAAAVGRLLAPPAELATISLAGRYRSLPRDRIELWLPAGLTERLAADIPG